MRIRLGMVGGGQGAFIGAVHRIAARLDDQFHLVCGALASDPTRALVSADALGLRGYASYAAMFAAEAARPDGMQAVVIVTPNHLHVPVARAALAAGFHVICDKPLAATLAEAESLAVPNGRIFAVTYNYSAYPMIRQARAMVAAGALGALRVVQIEYAQAWLAADLESTGQKQADWRTDPARTGPGGAIGDIGTHAFHLAGFVSGLAPDALLADLHRMVPGRRVDDNAHILLRYPGGARGMLWASQVAHGHENDLRLRLYGEAGGLEWRQEEPDWLWFTPAGEAKHLPTRGGAGAGPEAGRMSRIPAGHPEGYLEGFAGLYSEIAATIRNGGLPPEGVTFPTLADGVAGVRFVDAAVRSSAAGGVWTPLPA
jgi:predicted dehydrogenase